ncbi:MAG: glycosyltransferase family 2 protein [Thermoprotei archaeon]
MEPTQDTDKFEDSLSRHPTTPNSVAEEDLRATPKVTVAIVAHNSGKIIEDCLRSLEQQDYPKEKLNILVVDDSGDPQTIEACGKYGAEYVYAPDTNTPGKARNVALTKVSGDIVAFLDTDCVAPPDWLSRIVRDLQEHRGVEGVVGCYTGGRNWIQRVFNQESVVGSEIKTPVGILEGNCAFWVRSLQGKKFGVHRYSEGNVLSYQLAREGKKVLLDYDIKVVHNGFTYTPRKFYAMGRAQFHNNRDYLGGARRAEIFSVCVVLSLVLLFAIPFYGWVCVLPTIGVTAIFVEFSAKYQRKVPTKWLLQSYAYFVFVRWLFWLGYFTEYASHIFGRLRT